jgi:hypothetical protein
LTGYFTRGIIGVLDIRHPIDDREDIMDYKVKLLPDGKFTIEHPVVTFMGQWSYDTYEEAQKMIDWMMTEQKALARADAAWDNYDREYGDE